MSTSRIVVREPRVADPLAFMKSHWPDLNLYDQQREMVMSVFGNRVTAVPSAHKMGKDYVTGYIIPTAFAIRHPCRIVTTSVDGDQLEGVLWGEVRRAIQTSRFPLDAERGGPFVVNHLHLRKLIPFGKHAGELCGISYVIGRVAAGEEGMSGHHVARDDSGFPFALAVVDESSGVEAVTISKMEEWAHSMLMIGNCYECQNQFRWAVEGRPGTDDAGGDVPRDPRDPSKGYLRKVIRLRAEDSPNVKVALDEIAAGLAPSGRLVVPGVLPYEDYAHWRKTWDPAKQSAGLDASWYKGSEVLMFPPTWIDLSARAADALRGKKRTAAAMGIDPGEGGAETVWVVADGLGIIEMVAYPTPDTDVIPGVTLALIRKYGLDPANVLFDRGGGGKEHADRLRAMGYDVRTVAFGESLVPEPTTGTKGANLRLDEREERYTYKNRRAEMYDVLSQLLDPKRRGGEVFAIPAEYRELRRQLAPIPKTYDGEGRLYLLPKNKPSRDSKVKTLTELIGCSPDQADALVLAAYGVVSPAEEFVAGGFSYDDS